MQHRVAPRVTLGMLGFVVVTMLLVPTGAGARPMVADVVVESARTAGHATRNGVLTIARTVSSFVQTRYRARCLAVRPPGATIRPCTPRSPT